MNNSLIFGKDNTPNIVNITLKNDLAYIYTEANDGTVTLNKEPYQPFLLSPKKIAHRSERLKGEQYYRFITSVTCNKFLELQKSYNRDFWMPRQIEDAFLMETGVTYYKNKKVSDVSILSFDIETSGLVMDDTSTVFLISNTFRKNGQITKKLFSLEDYQNDWEMISDWTTWVSEMNPSVLCGHNILGYDLPYLAYVFDKQEHGSMLLGRDGSGIIFEEKTSKFRKDGSQQYDFHNVRITGREVIDTFFLSIKYDIGRDFPSYGLKPIIRHLGLEKANRAFIDASRMRQYFEERLTKPENWTLAKSYANDDSDDALQLFDLMVPSYFYLAQSIPKTMQQMINEATGSQLDALMIRSYLQEGYSQPKTSGKSEFEGAVSMGIPGVYDWVIKADVASLYPSIMLEYNIFDSKKDPDNHMIKILSYYRNERLKNKKLAKDTGEKYFDDLQNSQKILINSLYGFLGAGFLLYNYPKGAAEVTRRGREILLKGVEWATGYTLNRIIKKIVKEGTEDEKISFEWVLGEKIGEGKGYTLVNVDTDSFSLTRGSEVTQTEFTEFLKELNSIYPKSIEWANDGIYQKVIVLAAKNYVLVKNGKTTYKGSSLVDQKKEPALFEMLTKMLGALLDGESGALPTIYREYIKEAVHIEDIKRWCVKKTVSKSVLQSSVTATEKVKDAIDETIEKGIITKIQEGDKIWVYQAVKGEIQEVKKGLPTFYKDGRPKMIPNTILRDVRLWEQDQDVMHYVDRVYTTVDILSSVVNMDNFTDYTLKKNISQLNMLTNREDYGKVI